MGTIKAVSIRLAHAEQKKQDSSMPLGAVNVPFLNTWMKCCLHYYKVLLTF